MKNVSLVFVSIVLLLTAGSCKKFDEGGMVSRASKNIVEQWTMVSYIKNNVDQTSATEISGYSESYFSDGTCKRSYTTSDNKLREEQGSWKSNDNMYTVNVSGFSSLELSKSLGTVSSSAYNVLRLTKSEFWYRYQNGSDTHEFHFERKK